MLVASAPASRSGKHAYATLDGIRGVAAALIAIRHAGSLFPGWTMPHSALAVDMFFVISGFVIASAYDRRLADGLGPVGFMRVRLIRLYPLYLAGLLLGVVAALLLLQAGGYPRLSTGTLVTALLFSLVMLPTYDTWNDQVFPLNPPSWSLFFELAVNLVYAVAYPRITTRRLAAVAAMAGAILLAMALDGRNLDEGHSWDHFFDTGFVRVTYSFAVGLLLFRLPRRVATSSRMALLLLALVAVTLALPQQGAWYPVVAITVWMPALVFLATLVEPGAIVRRACHWLGRISYPLYVLHAPAAMIVAWALGAIGMTSPGAVAGLVFLIAMMAVAPMVDRWVGAWFGRGKPIGRSSGDPESIPVTAPDQGFGPGAERC